MEPVYIVLDAAEITPRLRSVWEAEHAKNASGARLSVNMSADGTRGLVKIVCERAAYAEVSGLLATHQNFTRADHDQARAMVLAPDWKPADSEADGKEPEQEPDDAVKGVR